MIETLALAALVLALLPALMALVNLALYRPPPPPDLRRHPSVSLLIPARDEEANIAAALDAAARSEGVELEIVVLDDHSTDRTGDIVKGRAARDPRIRLESAPVLPRGWSGKQHACFTLARLARHPLLVFVDADVRLMPDALARLARVLETRDAGLVSGFPEQSTGTFAERLLIPLIHVLLLGYLPMAGLRWTCLPGFGAACGQLIAVRADDYWKAGGHAAIRGSLHDGVTLPRAFRRAGVMTDLNDATGIARCRMYRGFDELWRGFSKNATEGMATPVALPVWTVLLIGGHVLPWLLLAAAFVSGAGAAVWLTAALAVGLNLLLRGTLAVRFRQSRAGLVLHPIAVLVLLALQWTALINHLRGRPAVWRNRAYSPG